ncbi:unnamed protein product [Camellia sinensis]
MSGYKIIVYKGLLGLSLEVRILPQVKIVYVERLLDCISNGVLAEDRRTNIAELQFVVAESRVAQLAFGAMGFPVLLSVLKEERDDVEMVIGSHSDYSLWNNSAYGHANGSKKLNLLVIRNEALLLLTYLTHEAKEIQKILVFEGAFEKIFSIIKEEGTINLLSALETIGLLIMGGPEIDTGKDANRLTNKAVSVQIKNLDGQAMLASTLIPQSQPTTHALRRIMLLHGLTLSQNDGDLEGAPEPLLHRVVKYLALATCMKSKEGKLNASGNTYVQAIILKLLVIWLSDCPSVVQCFPDSRPHLTYLLQLVSNSTTTVCIRGLAAVILRECVIYNKSSDSGNDVFTVVDAISQKVGLTSYFLKFKEMQKSIIFSSAKLAEPRKPLTRSTAASMAEIEDVEENKNLKADIRESIVDIYSHPKSKVAVVSAELQQKGGENNDLAKIGRGGSSQPKHRSSGGSERMESNLKSLFDAYNSLEQANFHLEKEIKALNCGEATPIPDVEAIKAEAREETQKESEAGLNDLLVRLRQE